MSNNTTTKIFFFHLRFCVCRYDAGCRTETYSFSSPFCFCSWFLSWLLRFLLSLLPVFTTFQIFFQSTFLIFLCILHLDSSYYRKTSTMYYFSFLVGEMKAARQLRSVSQQEESSKNLKLICWLLQHLHAWLCTNSIQLEGLSLTERNCNLSLMELFQDYCRLG